MTNKSTNEWEKEFSRKFTDHVLKDGYGNDLVEREATPIMKFISTLLSKERQELQKGLEKLIMIATTDAENQHCPHHLPCKSCVVYVRQKFLESLTLLDNHIER